jgi:CheY-like chemotaxis protein
MRPNALVLVVEDDIRTARLLARMLEDDGYRVDVRFDGATALTRLGESPAPDVIVTDYLLPRADVRALLATARRVATDVPIIVVTGYPELAAKLALEGDHGPIVLTKPVPYEALRAEIARVVACPSSG